MHTLKSRIDPAPLLQLAFLIDAVGSAGAGLAMLLFAAELGEVLALPAAGLATVGGLMLAYAALVAAMSRAPVLPRWAVWGVIGFNLLWAIDCLLLAFGGLLAPTAAGVAFLLGQAACVILFAHLQRAGLERSHHAPVARVADAH